MTGPKEFSTWSVAHSMGFLFFLGQNYAFYATMRFYAPLCDCDFGPTAVSVAM